MGLGKLSAILLLLFIVLGVLLFVKGLGGEDKTIVESLFDNSGNLSRLGGLLGSGNEKVIVSTKSSGELNLQIPNDDFVWSIDSAKIAFPANGEIWAVSSSGGKPYGLTTSESRKIGEFGGSNPALDPLSGSLVFVSHTEFHPPVLTNAILKKVSFNGGQRQDFAVLGIKNSGGSIRISSDGKMILMADRLYNGSLDDGKFSYSSVEENVPFGEFSADNSAIVFSEYSDGGIYKYNIGTKEREQIMSAECYYFDYCAKSNLAACTIKGQNNSDFTGCKQILLYNLDEKAGKQVVCDSSTTIGNPSFSPDCTKIAYRAFNHAEGTMIKVVNAT